MPQQRLYKLLGHWCVVSLLRRCALSVARASCDFARGGFMAEQRLWPSVLTELRIVRDLLPLLRADLRQQVHPVVTAFDACESGHASVDAKMEKMCWRKRRDGMHVGV